MDFDVSALTPRDAYKLLIGTVVPRPIALVTTLGEDGRVNAAPYSFFNALAHTPLMVALGMETRPDKRLKDTAENIRVTGEFVVNIVDEAIAEKMNICAIDFDDDVDELVEAGFATAPSAQIGPPRIAEAPASLECRRYVTLEMSRYRHIVLAEVLHLHYRDDIVDPRKLYVDAHRLNAVGRLGGPQYCTTRDVFDMPRIDVADWVKRKSGVAE